MEVLSSKAIGIMLIVVFALLIAFGAIAVLGGLEGLEIPGGDFFSQLGRMFDFLERQVGLAGKQTREWFCQKDLQKAVDLCKITPGMVKEYCGMVDEEKIGTCQTAGSAMKAFCNESWTKREEVCKDQNQFNSACDEIRTAGDIKSMKDMPFCK